MQQRMTHTRSISTSLQVVQPMVRLKQPECTSHPGLQACMLQQGRCSLQCITIDSSQPPNKR